jgi:hypothetical protein
MGKPKLTIEIFVERARAQHGDRYDYSRVDYIGCLSKVIIICPVHGEFLQTPISHIYKRASGRATGCRKCADDETSERSLLTTEQFIEKAKSIHGDRYDYSRVNYIGCSSDVIIICPVHGEFLQTPNAHTTAHAQGCKLCFRKSNGLARQKNIVGEIPIAYWKRTLLGAKSRRIAFDLTPEEAWSLYLSQDGKCALSGVPIFFRDERTASKNSHHSHTASLDRIDSNGIYIIGNVQWIDKKINVMKMDMDQTEFIAYCVLIAEHRIP